MTLAGSAAVIEGGQQLPFNDPFTCFLPAPADLSPPQVQAQAATPDIHSGLTVSQILLSAPRYGEIDGLRKTGGGHVDQNQRAESRGQKTETEPETETRNQRQKPEPDSRKQNQILENRIRYKKTEPQTETRDQMPEADTRKQNRNQKPEIRKQRQKAEPETRK